MRNIIPKRMLTFETRLTLRLITKNPSALAGLIIIFVFFTISLIGLWITPFDPFRLDLSSRLEPPNLAHPFGTDELGRDIFSRVIYGSHISLMVGLTSITSVLIIGLTVGGLTGYLGGKLDEMVMRITDAFLSFPSTILAMAIAAGMGPSLASSMIAIIAVWWPTYARVTRSKVLSTKQLPYIEAAKVTGETGLNILVRYILPNALSPIIVMMTLDIGNVILTAASLSFIGLGAQPPSPEWGAMINTGRVYILDAWWIPTFPGLAILSTALGFNLFGDGLRDALDPRLRRL